MACCGTTAEPRSDGSWPRSGWRTATTTASRTSCREVSAAGAVFENAVCLGADFRKAVLTGAAFDGCQARVADFRSAVLDGSSFRNADLGESDFTGAETGGAVFDDARMWNVRGLDSGHDRPTR